MQVVIENVGAETGALVLWKMINLRWLLDAAEVDRAI